MIVILMKIFGMEEVSLWLINRLSSAAIADEERSSFPAVRQVNNIINMANEVILVAVWDKFALPQSSVENYTMAS